MLPVALAILDNSCSLRTHLSYSQLALEESDISWGRQVPPPLKFLYANHHVEVSLGVLLNHVTDVVRLPSLLAKEAGSKLKGKCCPNWISISDRPSFCLFICLFACHFATVVVMNKKIRSHCGSEYLLWRWSQMIPITVSQSYSTLSKILALHSVFGKHEPKMDDLSGTPMSTISWLLPKPCVNHNVRRLNPRDWPNSECLDPESNISEDQRCLVTEILLLEEQGRRMLCISQETAACGFCLSSFVFHDTFEIRKKGAIKIKRIDKKLQESEKNPSYIPILMRIQVLLPSFGFLLQLLQPNFETSLENLKKVTWL